MKSYFNHILVPVNFNRNTEMVMDKAVKVANEFNCDVHGLHVQTPITAIPFLYDGHFTGSLFNSTTEQAEAKMKHLVSRYKTQLKDGLLMETTVSLGSWQQVMKDLIIAKHIDLVLIPRHRKRFFGALVQQVDVDRLSHQTQCPILTVTKKFDISHLQNIVVPVDDFLPVRKLTVATFLARKFNGIVHLMGKKTNSEEAGQQNSKCLTRAYQLIKDHTDVKVYFSTGEEEERGSGTLAYAKNVKADLIVVNPGKESVLKGWLSRLFGKFLYKESTIPVLTIAPHQPILSPQNE